MTIYIDINTVLNMVTLSPESITEDMWQGFIRVMSDYTSGISVKDSIIYIPLKEFLALRYQIQVFAKSHNIVIRLSEVSRNFLKLANTTSYTSAIKRPGLTEGEILARLQVVGFKRELTNNQLNNLKKLGPLPAGATFSVPGAGKTTEALAYFFLNAKPEDRLLVVAPKNAFSAWEEQIKDCVPSCKDTFVRLRGGEKRIDALLRNNPRFALITYQQYPRVSGLIKHYLQYNSAFMFLDESHRIKGGRSGVSADAILDASFLPIRKLIMSGTPMPQSVQDMLPQFSFLYPDKNAGTEDVVDLLQPIYVRTTQSQLGIPPVKRKIVSLPMSKLQSEVYASIKSEVKRQLMPMLTDASVYSLREIGKRVMKVMEFASNPALLAKDMEYVFNHKMGELLSSTNGPKIEYACRRAHELAAEGRKVLIWSQFVDNVELITERLRDLGADFIHGGVDAGDEDENDTREWKIKEFHDNPNKMVLVANPAAASEGISLHKVCQYAIYVDRSFNAAQYIQSEDRIHRLGLRPDQQPEVEILECIGTIDQVIRDRLNLKINTMASALNDPSLKVDAIPYDIDFNPEDEVTKEDAEAILKYFFE